MSNELTMSIHEAWVEHQYNVERLSEQFRALPREVRANAIANVKARCADLLEEAKVEGTDPAKVEETRKALMLVAKIMQVIGF